MVARVGSVLALNALWNAVSRTLLRGRGHDYVLRLLGSAVVGRTVSLEHVLCPYSYSTRISADLRELRQFARRRMPLEPWAKWVGTIVGRGDTVLDVGAHVGRHSLYFSYLCGDSGRVYALEPERGNYELLCSNIARNGIANVVPLQLAFSNRRGRCALHLNPRSGEGHSIIPDGHCWSGEQHQESVVDCDTLDAFCASRNIGTVKLAKIDVEGAQFLVLEGAVGMLEDGRIDVVVCEGGADTLPISGRTDTDLFAIMRELGYAAWRIIDDRLTPIDPNDEFEGLFDFVFINRKREEPLLRT
jgi:FkbM family methyltransferase